MSTKEKQIFIFIFYYKYNGTSYAQLMKGHLNHHKQKEVQKKSKTVFCNEQDKTWQMRKQNFLF